MSTLTSTTVTVQISDLAIRNYLKDFEPEQHPAALERAAKIGVLAIKAASGSLDVANVQGAFDTVHRRIHDTMKEYFENESGRVHRTLDTMLGEKGELARVIDKYFGAEGGQVSRVLREKLGPGSAFAKSLDLAHEESGLAKLQARLKQDLEEKTKGLFALLNEIKGKKETVESTTLKGEDFEKRVYPFIMDLAGKAGDVPALVGTTTGAIRNCKKGDIEVELAATSGAPGSRIVLECKQDKGYDLKASRAELVEAKKNRQAQVGIFVYAKGYEPAEVGDFSVVDGDLYCTVGDSFVYLEAAYRIARASVVLKAAGPKTEFDLGELQRRLAATGKAVEALSRLETSAVTAESAIGKVLDGVRLAKKNLARDLASIDELLTA